MEKAHRVAIVWFRRSIRIRDNHALTEALHAAEKIVPVFILDPAILTHPTTAPVRVRFLFESLTALDAELRERDGKLIIRHGKPVEQLERLIQETGATALYFGSEVEPYGRKRDKEVTAAMKKQDVTVVETSDHLLTEPGSLLSKAGTPYTVFTPYKRVWFEQPMDTPLPIPRHIPVPSGLSSESLPEVSCEVKSPVRGGEEEGLKWLRKFIPSCLGDYDTARNLPGTGGTSRLSAYLKMGVLSPRQVFEAVREHRASLPADQKVGADTFLSELAWRDFYYQILYHFPHVETGAFKPAYNDVAWENNEELFSAWREGRTGYPIVDAAQRQLVSQGWMHNRARMITASFLTKDLLCDWRWGERFFMQHLIDGDQASNNGGWQWAAGTGTDAQPFFRIFNPVSQGEKFDPDGTYVKRWVPELARIPTKYIHRPWSLSVAEQEAVQCVLGRDYPHPVVDHKEQRAKALHLYRTATDKKESEE